MPSYYWEGQIANPNYDKSANQLFDENGNHYPWGLFIGEDATTRERYLGSGFVGHDGNLVGPSVNEDAYNRLVDLWKARDNKTTQIDWESLYAANYANNANGPDASARYILERRHNDIHETMANFNYVNTQYDHLKMTLGVEGKVAQGVHYKTMEDLLGGNQWIDIDAFADRDIKELASNSGYTQDEIQLVVQNDLYHPNKAIKNGQRFGYDYRINMDHVKAWFQNEWTFNEVDVYYALAAEYNNMQRVTSMFNGRQAFLATLAYQRGTMWKYLGDNTDQYSKDRPFYYGNTHHFFDPAFKAGVVYKINGRNRLKLNALAQTRAPYARDAYISQRVHDRVIDEIYLHDTARTVQQFYAASEKLISTDLTYEFNYPIVRGRITGFFTQSWDGTELNGYYDDETRTFVNQALSEIDKRYMGVRNMFKKNNRSYYGLDFVFDEIPSRLLPYDFEEYRRSGENGFGAVTNIETGKTEYMRVKADDKKWSVLRASLS